MRRRAGQLTQLPQIVAGRRVRCVDLEIGPGLGLAVLEAADADVVLEQTIAGEGDPYAAVLWPSALAAVAELPRLLRRGDRVLDVGAGTGVVALAAARLGARAAALDHDPFSRAVIRAAADAQGLAVDIAEFDLRGAAPLPAADLVVMADLLYEPALVRAVARRTLEAVAAGTAVLVADPIRLGRAEYQRLMSAAGTPVAFSDVLVPVPGEPRPARAGVALLDPRPRRSGRPPEP